MEVKKKKIKVVGLGVSPSSLFENYRKIIKSADVLVGGGRFLELFKEYKAEKIPITSPLKETIKKVKEEFLKGKNVVVVADGDPGFFGIGRRLCEEVGSENIIIYPNISVLQVSAGKIGIPWDDVVCVSLHGRDDFYPLLNALSRNKKVALFTDSQNSPSCIARILLNSGVKGFKVYVFEDVGSDRERIGVYSLEDLVHREFSDLNFLIFLRYEYPEVPLSLGIDDDRFVHERGLITKKEVRAVAISLLNIMPDSILWDLGAGCGSVGIEAYSLITSGRVICVEKNPARVKQIKENIEKTFAFGVEVVLGEMPDCLDSLIAPDRVFMGGGVKKEVLEVVVKKLKQKGIWIIHTVLLRSFKEVIDFLKEKGWNFEVFQVHINRSKDLAGDKMLKSLNPVFIIKTVKP